MKIVIDTDNKNFKVDIITGEADVSKDGRHMLLEHAAIVASLAEALVNKFTICNSMTDKKETILALFDFGVEITEDAFRER